MTLHEEEAEEEEDSEDSKEEKIELDNEWKDVMKKVEEGRRGEAEEERKEGRKGKLKGEKMKGVECTEWKEGMMNWGEGRCIECGQERVVVVMEGVM